MSAFANFLAYISLDVQYDTVATNPIPMTADDKVLARAGDPESRLRWAASELAEFMIAVNNCRRLASNVSDRALGQAIHDAKQEFIDYSVLCRLFILSPTAVMKFTAAEFPNHGPAELCLLTHMMASAITISDLQYHMQVQKSRGRDVVIDSYAPLLAVCSC